MEGWIKDHRRELNSDIWSMPPIYHRVWQYIKYMANHEDNTIPMRDGSKLDIKKGQHLTSVRTIARKVGWYERGIFKEPNPKTIQSVLDWLEKSNMIYTNKSNRKYTLITVVNWAFYQADDNIKVTESNGVEVTERQQTADINNNDKNDKKKNKTLCHVEIISLLNEKAETNFKPTTKKTKELINARLSEGFTFEDLKTVVEYCCREWKGKTFNNGQPGDNYLRPSTLFNNKFEDRLNLAKKGSSNKKAKTNKFVDFENLEGENE